MLATVRPIHIYLPGFSGHALPPPSTCKIVVSQPKLSELIDTLSWLRAENVKRRLKEVAQEPPAASNVMPMAQCTKPLSNTPYYLPSGKCATPVVSFGIQHKQIFARLNSIAGYFASLNNCKIAKSSKLEIAVLSKPICM